MTTKRADLRAPGFLGWLLRDLEEAIAKAKKYRVSKNVVDDLFQIRCNVLAHIAAEHGSERKAKKALDEWRATTPSSNLVQFPINNKSKKDDRD